MTLRVYTVSASGERGPAREANPRGGSIFALGTRWPQCACPMSHADPQHAERVTTTEIRLGRDG